MCYGGIPIPFENDMNVFQDKPDRFGQPQPRTDLKRREGKWFTGVVTKPKLEEWDQNDLKLSEGIQTDDGLRVSESDYRRNLHNVERLNFANAPQKAASGITI
jgi:hypothetical protein